MRCSFCFSSSSYLGLVITATATIAAADEARAEQLAELTKQTDERKKKMKNPRKYNRLSLLSGSELGIPDTTTLG